MFLAEALRALHFTVYDSQANYLFFEASVPSIRKRFTPSSVVSMFQNCIGGQKTLDGTYLDTSLCRSFSMFAYNSCLREIVNLDISSATDLSLAFGLTALTRLTFAGETTPGGQTVDLSSGCLCHSALIKLINSLPAALSPAVLTITGNPGAEALTQDEIAAATAKNWTITI